MANKPHETKKVLVLHVEVPEYWADDLDEMASYCSEPDPPSDEDRLYVVTEEWMREEVGITLVGRPGDKCGNEDFVVYGYTGRIVGAHTRPKLRQDDGRLEDGG